LKRSTRALAALGGALLVFAAHAAEAPEALARAKGCFACHAADKKLVGPTYQEIARKYAGLADAEAKIATSIVKGTPVPGGVGWQKQGKAALPFMPPNSTLRPDEAASLAKWILSLK
jgi:cytochrome c